MAAPVTETDFGITFTGETGAAPPEATVPEEIVVAFRAFAKELLDLGVTDITYKNGADPSFIYLEVNASRGTLFSKRHEIYDVFLKIANEMSGPGQGLQAFTSHRMLGGYTVGMLGTTRPPSNG